MNVLAEVLMPILVGLLDGRADAHLTGSERIERVEALLRAHPFLAVQSTAPFCDAGSLLGIVVGARRFLVSVTSTLVRTLLTAGASAAHPFGAESSPLLVIASCRQGDAFEQLLECVDVNLADAHGWTALHVLCYRGDAARVAKLLRNSRLDMNRRVSGIVRPVDPPYSPPPIPTAGIRLHPYWKYDGSFKMPSFSPHTDSITFRTRKCRDTALELAIRAGHDNVVACLLKSGRVNVLPPRGACGGRYDAMMDWCEEMRTVRTLIGVFGAYRKARRAREEPASGSWQMTVVQQLPRPALAALMLHLKTGPFPHV